MTAKKTLSTLLMLALFATAAVLAPTARSVAKDMSAATLELSAQKQLDPNDPKNLKNKGNKQNFQKQNVQPKQNIQKKQVIIQQNNQIKVQKQQNIQVQKKVIVVQPGGGQKKFVGQPKVFKPTHNNLVYNFKLRGASQALVSGNTYTVYRNNYRRRYNGRFYTFVALGLLAPLAIGAAVYYPYAYLNVPANYCEGLTEDGCEMVYREVETVEGDLIPQCAAYCPWQ